MQPAVLEAKMKAKQWPPREDEKWTPAEAEALVGQQEAPIGHEEWHWLGPDPKRCDGQKNL